jgi:predicted transcriptional regulator
MDQQKYVIDVMLPLDENAVVSENESLYEAFIALEEAQKKRPQDRQKHRAVLVINSKNEIVGKLGHLGFLKSLEPGYKNLGELDMISKAGLTIEFISSMMKNFDLLQDEWDDIRIRTKTIKMKDVMHPMTEHVDINDTINEAIHKIIMWQILSCLVTKSGKVVGILRLVDLFDEVSSNILTKNK